MAAKWLWTAGAALVAVGLRAGPTVEEFSGAEKGRVLRTEPAAGAVVPIASPVTVFVSSGPAPVSVETFHALKQRQTTNTAAGEASMAGRVNLLNWDGNGVPNGMFPGPSEQR